MKDAKDIFDDFMYMSRKGKSRDRSQVNVYLKLEIRVNCRLVPENLGDDGSVLKLECNNGYTTL